MSIKPPQLPSVFCMLASTCLLVVTVGTAWKLSVTESELLHTMDVLQNVMVECDRLNAQKKDVARNLAELQREVEILKKEQEAGRFLAETLWQRLYHAPQIGTHAAPAGDEERPFDTEALLSALQKNDGDLEALLQAVVTETGVETTRKQHEQDPLCWVAAASLSRTPGRARDYLAQAAQRFPRSPAVLSGLIEADLRSNSASAATQKLIAELQRLDPSNGLADCYAVALYFGMGDTEGALEALAEAGRKSRLVDHSIDLVLTRKIFLLNEGCTDAVALGLSAFTVPLPHLALLRQAAGKALAQSQEMASDGNMHGALAVAEDVVRIARNLSTAGRSLVHDLVGIRIQTDALEQLKQLQENHGNSIGAERTGAGLEATEKRAREISIMTAAVPKALHCMTEADLAAYLDDLIVNGEFSALRRLPAVAEALDNSLDHTKP